MENTYWITIYYDTTPEFQRMTEDEAQEFISTHDNLCEIEITEEILDEWIWLTDSSKNHPEAMDTWRYEWLSEYDADWTDGLYQFAVDRYEYEPQIEL